MKYFFVIFFVCSMYAQKQLTEPFFLELNQMVQDGKISKDQMILEKFYYLKYPEKLSFLKYDGPVKCGTPFHMEYSAIKNELSFHTIEEIERPYNRIKKASQQSYISPLGKFQLNYSVTGNDAVDPTDNNSNNIPDYVEHAAHYLDESYRKEITETGFVDPVINNVYQVYFYNSVDFGEVRPNGDTSELYLHHTFNGFGQNGDENPILGAMKVTSAHEFKHSSQFATSGGNNEWGEDVSWSELDATWAEEFVYPNVNDYHRYLTWNGSHYVTPQLPLKQNRGYVNALFQIYIEQHFGVQFIVDVWNRRRVKKEAYESSLEAIAGSYGTTLSNIFSGFSSQLYFTKERTVQGMSFKDANEFSFASKVVDLTLAENETKGGSLSFSYSANRFQFKSFEKGDFYFTFSSELSSKNSTINFLITLNNGEGRRFILANDNEITIPYKSSQIKDIGVVVANGSEKSCNYSFSYRKTQTISAKSAFLYVQNPINQKGKVVLGDIDIPAKIHVYTILGQRIQTHTIPAKTTSFILNMSDLAAGIYFLNFEFKGSYVTRKIVKL